ncbi:SAM-dependent methyltransferase [Nitrospirillum pindoramense]|uniref:Precorrin-6B methylase 1 n=1 Tax=Nitrospirillum amazonense TaxID=28077 RepID=A0A560HDA8_9PROT|nr:SAM-dependent methyltransferase [Nitrospirillum amazonense]TWB43514.1 precorrin-6B methylase 1 [Nitrospirillum amazonense]
MPDTRIADAHAILSETKAKQSSGSLAIVGTGIQALGHLTREAEGHIRHADVVFHCIRDPLMLADLHALNPNVVDLTTLYGADKRRSLTYVQMAEVMVAEVRSGRRVTGVFYGHPGFYVAPARLALTTAKAEGYDTCLLPGVSSLDYLFADLRVDPSQSGYQALEATDFLLRNRPLVTSGHVVLMQVGPVGDLFRPVTDNLERRAILFERLIEIYGADHPCVDYVGATRPGQKPVLRRLKLGAYRDPANLKRLSKASTLYIPPKDSLDNDMAMAERLGIGAIVGKPLPAPTEPQAPVTLVPSAPPALSAAYFKAMQQIALDPNSAQAFRADPVRYVTSFGVLNADEQGWLAALGKSAAPVVPVVKLAATVEDVQEQNVSVEDVQEQNVSVEDVQEQNVSVEDVQEQNVSVEDVQEQNVSVEDVQEQNVSVEDVQEQNVSVEDVQEQNVSVEDVQEQNVSVEDVQEQNVSVEDVQEQNVSVEDVQEQNVSAE